MNFGRNRWERKKFDLYGDGAVKMIDTEHSRIHSGEMFFTGYYDNNVADDGLISILLQPGSYNLHFTWSAACGGDAELQYFEGVTFSDAGTVMNNFNKSRLSSNTCDCVVSHTPTITDTGTQFPTVFLPGGSGFLGRTPGAAATFSREFIFNKDLDYLIRVYNRAGSAQPISIRASWYQGGSS